MARIQTFGDLPFGAYFIVVRSDPETGNFFNANRTPNGAEIYRKLDAGRSLTMQELVRDNRRLDTSKTERYSVYSPFTAGSGIVENFVFSEDTTVIRIEDIDIYLFSLMDLTRITDWGEILTGQHHKFPTERITFADLPENKFFVVPDTKGRHGFREFDGGDHKADIYQKIARKNAEGQIYSHERAEGYDAKHDARTYYAADLCSMQGTTEISERVNNSTVVIPLHDNFFSFFYQASSPPEIIGPRSLKREKDFFKAGDKVWILLRSSDSLRWLPATIANVYETESMGRKWGPFINLVEDLGTCPGANRSIRFDSSDIWPRTK